MNVEYYVSYWKTDDLISDVKLYKNIKKKKPVEFI